MYYNVTIFEKDITLQLDVKPLLCLQITEWSENAKTIKYWTCRSGGPTCPIFCRSGQFFYKSGIKSPKIIGIFLSIRHGPTVFIFLQNGYKVFKPILQRITCLISLPFILTDYEIITLRMSPHCANWNRNTSLRWKRRCWPSWSETGPWVRYKDCRARWRTWMTCAVDAAAPLVSLIREQILLIYIICLFVFLS